MSRQTSSSRIASLRRPAGAATRLHTHRLIALVAASGLLTALALIASVWISLGNSRQMALDAATQSSRDITLAVTGAVARTIQSVDVLMISTARQLSEAPLPADARQIDQDLRHLLTFMPHVRQVAVIGADGTILGDSGERALTAGWPWRDVVSDGPNLGIAPRHSGRFLGPVSDGVHIHHVLPLTRKLTLHDGRAAFLVAAVNPLYFDDIFSSLSLPETARVRLWRFDGTLLVGKSGDSNHGPAGHADEPLFAQALKQAEYGTVTLPDSDGVTRITSYRTTVNWPLVISVGISRDGVLDRWRESALPLVWPVAAMVAVLLALTGALTRALITRTRSEAGLILSEQVLRTMSSGVAIADAAAPDMPLVYVNPAFETMTGYDAQAALGRNPRFLHGDDRDQPGLEKLRQALQAGQPASVVLRNYRPDGSLYWNDLTVSPVHAITGSLTHFVAIQRDITEQEENRVSLRKAYDRIERYSAELERFSFILAHHLQEPARHIVLYSQLVHRGVGTTIDPDLRDNLDYLVKAGIRLKELLRDVQLYLAMDRLAMAGGSAEAELILDKEWVNRSQGLDDADLNSGALPKVQVPPRRLADLFGILLDNSILFRHPDRVLRLTVSAIDLGNGFGEFTFSDNGLGIPPEFLEKVFGVFERLHGREQYQGNGVGLAIARKLVETLGGQIQARSDGCNGTTMIFTLPLASEE